MKSRVKKLDANMLEDGFWDNADAAAEVLKEKKSIEKKISSYDSLLAALDDAEEMLDLIDESISGGADIEDYAEELKEIAEEAADISSGTDSLSLETLLAGKYDDRDAILTIHAGTGGIDAMDWAEMLERMYLRYCEKKNLKADIVDLQNDTVAGIKSATIMVSGENAYGYLKSEHGVHRLVRISPFNSAGKRQTSFTAVEVVPQTDGELEVKINREDLKIDTYRSTGAGGQHVNTTDSAIRITHLPTNIVVTCQNERSQLRNKEVAMSILASRLLQLAEEQHKENLNELKGDMGQVTWGSQIRSYVFQPYTMVKDHRTGAETGNIGAVMDGELDMFIKAKLSQDAKEQNA